MDVNTTTAIPDTSAEPAGKVLPCNFRSAGRLSNDSIRHLRTMHDTFARNVAHSLDMFLGSPLGVKMVAVEQLGAREFASSLSSGSYLVPFTLMPLQNRIVIKFDGALMFPLLDLLLGGSGDPFEGTRELTEIDEELARSFTDLIAAQLEQTWKSCSVSVMPAASLKPSMLGQIFAMEERVISLHFEVTLGTTIAGMRVLLPMAFCHALVRSSQMESTRRIGQEHAGTHRLRERLLDCNMTLSAELLEAHITVGEMIDLRPGAVLNLRTAVQSPVRLSVGTYPLFEVTPVRRGGHKTAQLGRPCLPSQALQG